MLDKKNFASGQSASGFNRDMTLVTYASNTSKTQKKLVYFVSSIEFTKVHQRFVGLFRNIETVCSDAVKKQDGNTCYKE